MSSAVRWVRGAAIAAGAVGYACLAHHTNTARTETLGMCVALAPLVLTALSIAWHSAHRVMSGAILVAASTALVLAWTSVEHHFSWLYWVEHAGTELLLCLWFVRSLGHGREPMCTYFARMVHGSLTSEIERYTRQITIAWAIFFGSVAAVSTILFHAAPLHVWSVFANFITAPLIALMFIAEYIVRRYLHPDMEHAHILAAVKAFWKKPVRS